MWLDYKGKRHFLPTEMPEEPKNETDIKSHLYTDKDVDGNKKKFRLFDFLGNNGLNNGGNSERADHTA